MKLIGVFGGTFDPPHVGHAFIIRSLLKTLPFDEIKVIPTGTPPHRSLPIAHASHRYKMTSLMVNSIPNVSVDEREIIKKGPSYTFDTLSEIRFCFGSEANLALIVGMDAFSGFPKWHLPIKILELAHMIVIPRAGIKPSVVKHSVEQTLTTLGVGSKKLFLLPQMLISSNHPGVYISRINPPDVSSTLIRQKILQGSEIKPFVPTKVWEYIERNRLYRTDPIRTNPE